MMDYRAQFRGTPSSVREARQAILDYAKLCGFAAEEMFDIALGAGEALANAVEHGNKDLGFIAVSCTFDNGVLIIEVSDSGPGFDVARHETKHREPDAIRGFGISIMRSVMDAVDYMARGTTVRLHKRRAASGTEKRPGTSGETRNR
ncbi:MAG: ATP-binding protein [Candidatus Eremiobacteraeota bacterium]|nr:ATP-binding protein [Candidatus Eremiobacteraeota bacterium]